MGNSSKDLPLSAYRLPLSMEELQLIADVGGIPVRKVATIVELTCKAIADKGGFVLTGGNMVRVANANAAWNMPIDAQEVKGDEVG